MALAGGAMNTLGNIQKGLQVADAAETAAQVSKSANKYDKRLNNPGMVPRKTAPSITKMSAEKEDGIDKSKKRKPLTKAQKTAIGLGATVGAIMLYNIATTGNVLGPLRAAESGIKKAPNAVFNSAKSGNFGPGAAVVANGLGQAVGGTKKPATDFYSMGNSGGNKQEKFNSGVPIAEFAKGLSLGGGILAAHLLGEKVLKNKSVKKSYESNALQNKAIKDYHKTKKVNLPYYNDVKNVADVLTKLDEK